MRTNRTTRALSALTLTTALALTAAACGNDDASTDTSSEVSTTEHNDADVEFASNMLQHHAQALAMVDLTIDRTLDPEVQQLAEQIRDAQAPEIETFTDWLTDWDEEVPETVRDHANAGHDMDDMGDSMNDENMPGMMSSDDMSALEDASDGEFQTMWLEMMIEHHEGAVEMAKTEQGDGRYKDAVDLAGNIVTSQTAEIETMKGLLP
ncbi:Uncharacterized conserved protein, DUF305 family [Nocardioides alpinus]|uniref:DUF305 domain-containing protein n=2 Tax=Nocardioides alpinus TaxID=748909 RepID=A0A1I0WET9_9ACTN|nr:DUF305 domain-containing protein [Nocardioides alpinus]PKH37868.1 DUF305 domain-containing protein [Nocardioides alpinus]SFA86927.1 Uncharacterized conserved protein, DUF305 family [Nocardioides alpinus]